MDSSEQKSEDNGDNGVDINLKYLRKLWRAIDMSQLHQQRVEHFYIHTNTENVLNDLLMRVSVMQNVAPNKTSVPVQKKKKQNKKRKLETTSITTATGSLAKKSRRQLKLKR